MELSPVIEIEKKGKIKHTEAGCQGEIAKWKWG